ncbi:hypothetical protein Q7P37_003416 [Cladosporium fusiforme]
MRPAFWCWLALAQAQAEHQTSRATAGQTKDGQTTPATPSLQLPPRTLAHRPVACQSRVPPTYSAARHPPPPLLQHHATTFTLPSHPPPLTLSLTTSRLTSHLPDITLLAPGRPLRLHMKSLGRKDQFIHGKTATFHQPHCTPTGLALAFTSP